MTKRCLSQQKKGRGASTASAGVFGKGLFDHAIADIAEPKSSASSSSAPAAKKGAFLASLIQVS